MRQRQYERAVTRAGDVSVFMCCSGVAVFTGRLAIESLCSGWSRGPSPRPGAHFGRCQVHAGPPADRDRCRSASAATDHHKRPRGSGAPGFSRQCNAFGREVLRLKTPWRDSISHLVMSPLEFMHRLAVLRRLRVHPPRTASRPSISAVEFPVWVASGRSPQHPQAGTHPCMRHPPRPRRCPRRLNLRSTAAPTRTSAPSPRRR